MARREIPDVSSAAGRIGSALQNSTMVGAFIVRRDVGIAPYEWFIGNRCVGAGFYPALLVCDGFSVNGGRGRAPPLRNVYRTSS